MSAESSTVQHNDVNKISIDQHGQDEASLPPSLFEAKFKPQVGVDIHTQLPEAHIHKGLLSQESIASAVQFCKTLEVKGCQGIEFKTQQHTEQNSSSAAPHITKDFINEELYGERAIVLHNVLTPDECLEISSLTERIEMHDANQDHRVRNNMRCEINSIPLAQILFHRVFPFVEHEKCVTDKNASDYIQGQLMKGDWQICGLNDHFRLCYYLGSNKGHFGAHYDGEYNPSPDVCSIKTFMLYLNDDYEGGSTNFLKEHMLYFDEARNIYCSPPEHVVAGLKAKQGDCLIFDHKILHEGSQVLSGKKFIFRSELIYKRTGESEMTEEQRKGCEFLAQARYHEDSKNFETAVKFYQKAFKIYPELEKLV